MGKTVVRRRKLRPRGLFLGVGVERLAAVPPISVGMPVASWSGFTMARVRVPYFGRCCKPPVGFETDPGPCSCGLALSTAMKIDFPIISTTATL
jgi:hypothetical protein